MPVQALASQGFAVLSFNRPAPIPAAQAATSDIAMRLANRKDWSDRRSVQSALEIAIHLAVDTGTIDAARMGISGLSDGTSTTQWALLNSRLFHAAVIGSCCEDRYAQQLDGGPGYTKFLREMGYPAFDADDPDFWRPLSLSLNAGRLDVPLLIQASDTEYEMALDTVTALQERNKPVEMHIFPDEVHFKWQPAHRLAMYDRTIDWFSFWLMHRADCVAGKGARYARWLGMRGAPSVNALTCRDGSPFHP